LAAVTLLLDGAKGAAAVLIAVWFGGRDAIAWAGIGAVLGHAFPVWLGFRGGKAVATSYGALIAAAWPVGILAGAIWLVMAALSRISSLAALASFALAPVIAAVLADAAVVKLALVIAVLVFARHHTNIRRLIAGTEPRIGQKA
jgi:glycerol-3-phosphate acyltransferase PlsY